MHQLKHFGHLNPELPSNFASPTLQIYELHKEKKWSCNGQSSESQAGRIRSSILIAFSFYPRAGKTIELDSTTAFSTFLFSKCPKQNQSILYTEKCFFSLFFCVCVCLQMVRVNKKKVCFKLSFSRCLFCFLH